MVREKILLSNINYILQVGDKLDQIGEWASENLQQSQMYQKSPYDHHVILPEFNQDRKDYYLLLPLQANY